jgi:hypothetical protein
MAVLKYNTGDGGTNTTAVTTGNSGGASGDAWGNVVGGAGVWTYSNAQTVKGGMAYSCVQAAGVAAGLQMDLGSAQATTYGRMYVYLTAFPASEQAVMKAFGPAFAQGWRIAFSSTGLLRVRDAAATLLTTSVASITTNAWWRVEWRVVSGIGTSGQITVNVYSGDSMTPATTYTNNACNTGASTNNYQFGPVISSPQMPLMYYDEMVADNAGFPGPANLVNQSPVANAGIDQNILEGSIVTLNGTGSNDADGTISTYAWSQTSGASVTLSSLSAAQPTFTAPAAPAALVFQLTVTDNSGATNTDSVSITVGSTLFRFNKAEGGSNATTVTVGNSGGASGDPWSSVSGTDSWTYTNVNVARGALGYRCEQKAAEAAVLDWNFTGLTELYGRSYFYLTGYAPATQTLVRLFGANGTNEVFRIDLLTTGQLRLRDAAGTTLSTSPSSLQTGVWYRFEWHVISGVANGTIDCRIFTADQTSALYSYANAACNTFTATTNAQFGPAFSTTVLPVLFLDEIALNLNGWIGPAAGTLLNSPPTANAGPDQSVSMNTAVTLTGSASTDIDGIIASYTWSQISGTSVALSSANTAQPTFTSPGTAGALTFQVIVTDNNGATGSDTVIITVLPAIVLTNTGEGGIDGVSATVGNSGGGSGDAWQSVNGSAWKYSSAHTARGSISYKCDQLNNTAATLQWQLPSITEHYGRVYMYMSTLVAVADPFVRVFAAGFTEAFRLEKSSSNHLSVRDATGTARYTGSSEFTTGVWYRIEWRAISSATTGQLQVRVYVADQVTPIESFTSSANLNIRAETSWVQFGPSFSLNPAPGSKWFDEMAIGSTASGWLGSAPGTPINQAPVAYAGPDATIEPKTMHTLSGSATDDGSITSWQWRQISGQAVTLSSVTSQNPTFTAPAIQGGGELVFGLIATDDGSQASVEDTVKITVLTPTIYYARGGSWSTS